MDKTDPVSSDDESDYGSIRIPPAFSGYCPFPPVINAYYNYSMNVIKTLTTVKLCGATENDFLYLGELHVGYTPRGPLNWKPGIYLRNGTTKNDPVFAAAGDTTIFILPASPFDLDSIIMLPPLNLEANPRDLITEIMRASTTDTSEQPVAFRFAVGVGVKRREREEFEWRKIKTHIIADRDTRSRYILLRLPPTPSGPSSSSAAATQTSPADEDCQAVAELVFTNLTSLKHIFTLELTNAGRTGELGDRWALMAVMTALRLWWLRQYGKTRKGTVVVAEKVRSK